MEIRTTMTIVLKTLAVIVLIAAVPLHAQDGAGRGIHNRMPRLGQLAVIADDGAQSRPANDPVTNTASPDPSRQNYPQTYFRPWRLFPWGIYAIPVAIVAVVLFFKHRRNAMMHQTLRAMIEKGVPVTPELVAALRSQCDGGGQRMCYLLPGLIFSAVGIGLLINAGRGGLIPLLIGIAFLVSWQVEKRSTHGNQPPGQ